jgi:hypothetical protein
VARGSDSPAWLAERQEEKKMTVKTIVNEAKRGCGFRKKGGTYLITDATTLEDCGKLPLPLDVCPCCGQGVKASRGWTWVNAKLLFAEKKCNFSDRGEICHCVLDNPPEKAGLLWIGEKFYKTPGEFMAEGAAQGFSRRVAMIPRDFELGKTWVMFAHRKAIRKMVVCGDCHGTGKLEGDAQCDSCEGKGQVEFSGPGIFFMFKPERVEYIIADKDTAEELERKEKRGFTLVNLVRTDDDLDLDDGQPSEQQENEDFAHDGYLDNIDASEVL